MEDEDKFFMSAVWNQSLESENASQSLQGSQRKPKSTIPPDRGSGRTAFWNTADKCSLKPRPKKNSVNTVSKYSEQQGTEIGSSASYSSRENGREHGQAARAYNNNTRLSRNVGDDGESRNKHHGRKFPNSRGNKSKSQTNLSTEDTWQNSEYLKQPKPSEHVKKNKISRPASFLFLQDLITKQPNEILLTINTRDSSFMVLIQQDKVRVDIMALALIAMGKSCMADLNNGVCSLINSIQSNTSFLMISIPTYLVEVRQINPKNFHFESLFYLTVFLQKFQRTMPSSSSDSISVMLPLLSLTCDRMLNSHKLYSDTKLKLKDIDEENEQYLKKHTRTEIKKTSVREQINLLQPPENYRTISVLPTVDDIHTPEAFLRPNIVKGKYLNTEHYLDIQYRLLREDYIRPLREGIASYLNSKDKAKSVRSFQDVRVYQNVHIVKQDFVNGGMVHIAQFPKDKFAHIKWEYSKRFLTGSLLCLSSDDFKTMLFASVARRIPAELKKGLLLIRFETISDEVLNISPVKSFVVIETTSYFEAYRYNLKALHELNEGNLPLQKYIVEVEKTVDHPSYLNDTTTYDMRPLLLPLDEKYILKSVDIDGTLSQKYDFPPNLPTEAKNIRILDDNFWPSESDLNLDHSQYLALKAAITREFAIIQGPPGTGKTYIGLRIAQLLLHNIEKWLVKNTNTLPILVVCFTNHALDQFLEGLMQFTNKIVRIGGQGTNEALSQFQLNNLKRIAVSKKEMPKYISHCMWQKNNELRCLKLEIERKNKSVQKSVSCVLGEYEMEMEDCIPKQHHASLKNKIKQPPYKHLVDDGHIIHDWLGVRFRMGELFDTPQISKPKKEIVQSNSSTANVDDSGRQVQGGKAQQKKHIQHCLQNAEPFEEEEAMKIKNVWAMSIPQRWQLYKFWLQKYIAEKQNGCFEQQFKELLKAVQKSETCVPGECEMGDSLPTHQYASLKSKIKQPPYKHLADDGFIIHDWLEVRFRMGEYANITDAAGEDGGNDSAGEADIEFIEAQRNIDSEDFADVSFNIEPTEQEDSLAIVDDSGWQVQGGKKQQQKHIQHCLQNTEPFEEEEAMKIQNVWATSIPQRWRLYKFWLQRYIAEKQKKCFEQQLELKKLFEEVREMRTEEDICILERAHVVGMTTTGAAKYRDIVLRLNPQILIVEEAAEILESHIVTSVAPKTQHVILIGDHQQLRPSPTVHALAVRYGLNVSLFERMIKNEMDCFMLSLQHRMRPDIADLITPHIYKDLKNHDDVTKFENIKGVSKNVFFITHDYNERQESDSKSKTNEHEARFLVKLCKYFVLQGYEPSQITVLTTYTGQLFVLKKLVTDVIRKVRITVVDNYQGEENDIILVSFVRSNEEGEIGFLKVANRVCVALSRARKGLYCIGNFELLAEKSDLWKNIVNTLQQKQAIGSSLQLMCQNHPGVYSVVASEQDFESVPEGGCTRACEYRLACGHVCSLMCHPYDPAHETIRCYKECNKTCDFGHKCRKKCHEQCGDCKYFIDKTNYSCGHTVKVPCYNRSEEIKCKEKCNKMLSCGHDCPNICSEACAIVCKEMITTTSPICGHQVTIECCFTSRPDKLTESCQHPCNAVLECEHLCNGNCSRCHQGRLHVACDNPCKRVLVCGHECSSPCSKSCPPCKRPCENRCVHSKCPKKCGVPCEECTENCVWYCPHKRCSRLCGEICNRVPCNEPCQRLLPCKHACIGFCGEPCPKECRECNEAVVKEIFFGTEDEEDARFVCLEECGHILEISGLTHWMKTDSKADSEIQMKVCPKCKTVIRRNLRFGNVVKDCLKKIEKVKRLTFGSLDKNKEMQNRLLKCIEKNELLFRDIKNGTQICKSLENCLKAKRNRSVQEITTMENIYRAFLKLASAVNCSVLSLAEQDYSIKESIAALWRFMEATKFWLLEFIQDEYLTASEQQLNQLTWEIHRLKLGKKLIKLTKEHKIKSPFIDFQKCISLLVSYTPFGNSDVKAFSESFQNVVRSCGSAVINISDLEKDQILKALNLSKGHWYQCPNGHVYCITECGGAVQTGRCNECNAEIGGTNHSLLRTNTVATDMDGAFHSAWSDAMNMDNYRLENDDDDEYP